MKQKNQKQILKELLSTKEKRLLESLNSPAKIQNFLNAIPYHLADTAYSPLMVLRHKTAHCLEGAIFAAAALSWHGKPPLLLDLEAENDSDHVIAPFQENGSWGAIASSNYTGLRYRAPVYKNIRELAMSYFNDYFNKRRQRTLRAFSKPINLNRFNKQNWTIAKNTWFIVDHLIEIPHTQLLSDKMIQSLTPVDARSLGAGMYGMRKK